MEVCVVGGVLCCLWTCEEVLKPLSAVTNKVLILPCFMSAGEIYTTCTYIIYISIKGTTRRRWGSFLWLLLLFLVLSGQPLVSFLSSLVRKIQNYQIIIKIIKIISGQPPASFLPSLARKMNILVNNWHDDKYKEKVDDKANWYMNGVGWFVSVRDRLEIFTFPCMKTKSLSCGPTTLSNVPPGQLSHLCHFVIHCRGPFVWELFWKPTDRKTGSVDKL